METLFVGKNLIFLPETNSTNSYAIDLLKNVNPPEGTVVQTARQLKGKGQRGAAWTSEPLSNLTASIILKPSFLPLSRQFNLYIISALAVHDTTSQFLKTGQFDIKIKWPNDILVNRKKISGVLIENKLQNDLISWSVIGVGLNINQLEFELQHATSLRLLVNSEMNVRKCLDLLCQFIEKYYLMLKAGKYEELHALYMERLFGINEILDFIFNDTLVQMKVEGLSDRGLLRLEKANGEKVEADLRELRWIF
jgi:BirA family biotin operon repressor/biotin-[acetyl-CoA-carboxylase] ligase